MNRGLQLALTLYTIQHSLGAPFRGPCGQAGAAPYSRAREGTGALRITGPAPLGG
jgi:hypothetical protein